MFFGTGSDEVERLRDEFSCITCGMCKHFKVRADIDGEDSNCKRLDHKKVRFHEPWFKSYDCGQFGQKICGDFNPDFSSAPALEKLWLGIDAYVGEIPDKELIGLRLKRDPDKIYRVKYKEFYDGSFSDGKTIRVFGTFEQKRSPKSPTGYMGVTKRFDEPVLVPIDIEA